MKLLDKYEKVTHGDWIIEIEVQKIDNKDKYPMGMKYGLICVNKINKKI